jgi:hypothetical protein
MLSRVLLSAIPSRTSLAWKRHMKREPFSKRLRSTRVAGEQRVWTIM